MGFFKQHRDMAKMAHAAPALVAQAQALQSQLAQYQQSAEGQYQQALDSQAMHVLAAEPQPGNLEPIAGVDLEHYAKIMRGIAPYGYDSMRLIDVAAAFGVDAASWAQAQEGWTARIQVDRGVGRRFNEYYTAA